MLEGEKSKLKTIRLLPEWTTVLYCVVLPDHPTPTINLGRNMYHEKNARGVEIIGSKMSTVFGYTIHACESVFLKNELDK